VKRREFIALLGGAAIGPCPRLAAAQQAWLRRIGYLWPGL
jgi:hypothetical protein